MEKNTYEPSGATVPEKREDAKTGGISLQDTYETLSRLESWLERGYIRDLSQAGDFSLEGLKYKKITWLQLFRLPISPSSEELYDLTSYWQNALATFNVWGNKFVFLLLRKGGETNIFFGVASNTQTPGDAVRQLRQVTSAAIPGIEVIPLDGKKDEEHTTNKMITDKLIEFTALGTITGLPSLREGKGENVQTLDALAFGFKGEVSEFTDYAVVVIAEPVAEDEIDDMVNSLRNYAERVHGLVKGSSSISRGTSESLGNSEGKSSQKSVGLSMGHMLPVVPSVNKSSGENSGTFESRGTSETQSYTVDVINKRAEYLEQVLENYITRLQRGRNLGFWNTGVYALARTNNDVKTVLGLLKSIYSGDNSYIEPIRANLIRDYGATEAVKSFQLLPYPIEGMVHPLGKLFSHVSTPMNTEELSIATSLPRRDVPGVRFSKTAVRFATNPAPLEDKEVMEIGSILDLGVEQKQKYYMSPDALVRHALVAGCTGSGKSTTCKKFLSEIDKRDIPSLIIEPAKDDYVRWAIAYNKRIDEDDSLTEEEKDARKWDIYMPGVNELDGYKLKKLKINPFEPAAIEGAPIDLMSRYEQVVTIINASVPASDVLPVLIDETIYRFMRDYFEEDFQKTESEQRQEYPKISGILEVARKVLEERNYDKKVQNDMAAALETRFQYLSRGKRGAILDVRKSVDYGRLFGHKSVVNLSRLIGTKDKALIMSFLIVALYEYRISAFSYDEAYRSRANQNKLMHLTLIEEAHNLLQNPEYDIGGTGNPQKVSAEMFTNILSEIRSYGQGLIIVDQVPTRLIPDAVKNTNYKIIHRLTAADDAQVVAASMALMPEQAGVISKLRIGEAIIFGDLDDAALWVKIKRSEGN